MSYTQGHQDSFFSTYINFCNVRYETSKGLYIIRSGHHPRNETTGRIPRYAAWVIKSPIKNDKIYGCVFYNTQSREVSIADAKKHISNSLPKRQY